MFVFCLPYYGGKMSYLYYLMARFATYIIAHLSNIARQSQLQQQVKNWCLEFVGASRPSNIDYNIISGGTDLQQCAFITTL